MAQALPYKLELGGQLISRQEFLDIFHRIRDFPKPVFRTDDKGDLLKFGSRAQIPREATAAATLPDATTAEPRGES